MNNQNKKNGLAASGSKLLIGLAAAGAVYAAPVLTPVNEVEAQALEPVIQETLNGLNPFNDSENRNRHSRSSRSSRNSRSSRSSRNSRSSRGSRG